MGPDHCTPALTPAPRQCGAATPQVSACETQCVAESIYGGGPDGCHATADCNGVSLDLNCMDTSDGVPCSCSLDGTKVWEIASGHGNSKSACTGAELFRLCARALP